MIENAMSDLKFHASFSITSQPYFNVLKVFRENVSLYNKIQWHKEKRGLFHSRLIVSKWVEPWLAGLFCLMRRLLFASCFSLSWGVYLVCTIEMGFWGPICRKCWKTWQAVSSRSDTELISIPFAHRTGANLITWPPSPQRTLGNVVSSRVRIELGRKRSTSTRKSNTYFPLTLSS